MKLSVVIPVRNGGEDFRHCLEALRTSTRLPDEIIVVDDASTDASVITAVASGAHVLSQAELPVGPARSRNRGAAVAQGDILVFVDADVVVHRNTLAAIETYLTAHPEIAALFGSYDDAPRHRGLVSLYKNLQHHFVHQHSDQEASTFWSGMGAIRRDVFIKLGGFNESYSRPSVEDIELGIRLRQAGYKVRLCPYIQAKHLKQWQITSLLRTDIFDRAVPWTRLILSTSRVPSDLNLDYKSRLSTLLLWAFLFCLFVGIWFQVSWIGALLLLGLLIAINFPLYHFFYMRNGFRFALGGIALHLLYFLYSSLTFTVVWIEHTLAKAYRHIIAPLNLDKLAGDFWYGK